MTDTGVLRSIAEAGGDPTTEQVLAACDDLDALKADNARLRALVKAAEFGPNHRCSWCGAERYVKGSDPHAPDCPAFTADGVVK